MYDSTHRHTSHFSCPIRNALVAICLLAGSQAFGQSTIHGVHGADSANPTVPQAFYASLAPASDTASLPDAPEPQGDLAAEYSSSGAAAPPSRTPRFAPKPLAPLYNKYIEPTQRAQPLLGVRNKVLFGLDQIVSPYFLVSVAASGAYEHAINGSPNYGTDGNAFGQRVGAAAATNASQSIFTDGVMPAVFHQDPRYYVRGHGHSLASRGGYAISRVFITRSDSGENVPNYSLFAGHAVTAGLQNAYYPAPNTGAVESAKSYANSFAGTALSNGIREFFPDLLHLAHLE